MNKKTSNNKGGWHCSGYGVFPGGQKCKGCTDCDFGNEVMTMDEIKADINSRTVRVTKNMDLKKVITGIVNKRYKKR